MNTQQKIATLHKTRPYDGRKVVLHEVRGGWHFNGLEGVCRRISGDGKQLVMMVEYDPEGFWPAGMEVLVDVDHETRPYFEELT